MIGVVAPKLGGIDLKLGMITLILLKSIFSDHVLGLGHD